MSCKVTLFDRIVYYKDETCGEYHREDGPALEFNNGRKEWYINNLCHREDGPAITQENGSKAWYKNGKRHREDGPAVVWKYFNPYYEEVSYYLYGRRYEEEKYWAMIKFGSFV